MTPEQEVMRGKLAADVLDSPAYQEAYATVDAALIKAWREARDRNDREDLHKMLGLLSRVQGAMEGVMRNGQIAQKELLRKRSLAEKLGGFRQ